MITLLMNLFLCVFGLAEAASTVASTAESAAKSTVKYRQHSEVDLSGSTIQGKFRNPAIFYVFQRKRADSPSVMSIPKNLEHHRQPTRDVLGEMLQ